MTVHTQGHCPHQDNALDNRARVTAVCTDPDHADMIEMYGSCDTCGMFASQLDGYDRNGAYDGFQVVSDADPGL